MKFGHAAAVLVVTSAMAVWAASAQAGTKHHLPAPESTPAAQRPGYTFDHCDLPTVFKLLAQEARVKLDLDYSIRGTVNMRMEDITEPKQVMEVLAQVENLKLEVVNGAYHISATDKTDDAHKGGEKPAEGFEAFTEAFGKTFDGLTDVATKPEMAAKFARYKRSYYLALIKEGFSAEEALKIVVAAGEPGLGNDQKGK